MPIFSGGYSQKSTPQDDDYVLIADSAASQAIKKTKVSAILNRILSLTQWIKPEDLDMDEFDTGWITLPLASGVTANSSTTPAYRIKFGVVYFQGSVTGSWSASSSNYISDELTALTAAGFDKGEVRTMGGYLTSSTNSRPGKGYVTADNRLVAAISSSDPQGMPSYLSLEGMSGILLVD